MIDEMEHYSLVMFSRKIKRKKDGRSYPLFYLVGGSMGRNEKIFILQYLANYLSKISPI